MRLSVMHFALALAACGSGDDRDSASGFTTAVTTITTANTVSTGEDATSSDGTTTTPTTTTAPASTTTATTDPSTTTAPASTTQPDPTTTGVADTTGSTGADTGEPGCPSPGDPDCSPGPGSGEPDTCAKGETCFREIVKGAVQQVLAEHPEWFMHDDVMGDFVLEVEMYMNTVVALVSATGLCAIRDPNAGDEIAVKFDNDFAESFDILTAAGYARYGDGINTSTCSPAWY